MRATAGDTGKLKIEFKDQGQSILQTNEGQKTLTSTWTRYSTTATAPPGTWQVTVVCVADSPYNTVQYDDIVLTEYDFDPRDLCDMSQNWLTADPQNDIAPPPFGDGIVNLPDFAILADNWLISN